MTLRKVRVVADRLDREAVTRILARAHDLEGVPASDESGVEPAALIEAAQEVGIDANAVRDSIAIERFTVQVPARRRFDGVAGPAELVVERELHVSVADALTPPSP